MHRSFLPNTTRYSVRIKNVDRDAFPTLFYQATLFISSYLVLEHKYLVVVWGYHNHYNYNPPCYNIKGHPNLLFGIFKHGFIALEEKMIASHLP